MVYCSRCGTLNSDTLVNCLNCGAPLNPTQTSQPYTYNEHRHHLRRYDDGYRHGGTGFGLLIAGLFIILIGVAAFAGFSIWAFIWPLILILVGIWVITLGLRRNRRYSQSA